MHSSINKSLLVIVCLACCFFTVAHPQEPVEESDATARGVALYEQGDTEDAIKLLREAVKTSKNEARAWHYLGLAFVRQGKSKEAERAFVQAIDLRSKALDREFRRSEEWRDDRLKNLTALLGGQIESQIKLLELVSDEEAVEKGRLDLETSKIRAACVEESTKSGTDGHPVLTKSDLKIQRPKILSKTEPAFPAGVHESNVTANVILKALFASDNSVRYIETIQSSGDIFTEAAVKAAKSTKFQPASICGKPISFSLQLEYGFSRF